MTKFHQLQTDFTGGELDPALFGRVTSDRYGVAAQEMENFWVRVSGGAEGRDGLRYINNARDDTGIIRLIPWVYNRDQSYVLEFTDNKLRFIQSGQLVTAADTGPAAYEITTGIPGDSLATLAYAQSADTMVFVHPTMKPKKLVRNSQRDWVMSDIVFDILPFDELSQSPDGWATLDKNDYIGQTVVVTLTNDANGAAYTGTGFVAGDVGKYVRVYDGLMRIKTVTDKAHVTGELRTIMTVSQTSGDGTAANPKKWPPAPSDNWKRLETMWTDALGWPSCVCFHQQRLVFAGTSKFPQYIWGSQIRGFYNFELGALDNSAWSFQLDSDQVNPILHLFSMNALIALTSMNEFLITSPTGAITPTAVNVRCPSQFGSNPVLPVRVAQDLLYLQRGSHKLLALNYDPDNTTGYQVTELSLLAENQLEAGVLDMTAQSQPRNRIHLLKLDGTISTLTVNKQVGIAAWSRTTTAGAFISCATIPRADGTDDTYVAVIRNINGVPKVLLEHFQPNVFMDSAIIGQIENASDPAQQGWNKLEHLEGREVNVLGDGVVMSNRTVVNGAITIDRPARRVVIGLNYTPRLQLLRPEASLQNGSMQGSKVGITRVRIRVKDSIGMTVSNPPDEAKALAAGLDFDAYHQVVPFRHFGKDILDAPSVPYSGDIDWRQLGWDNAETIISQPQPLPIHIIAVVRDITVND